MSRQIHVGSVAVGGGASVSIQSMTNTPTHDVEATLAQIKALATAGCDIVRVAVPDERAAQAIGALKAGRHHYSQYFQLSAHIYGRLPLRTVRDQA